MMQSNVWHPRRVHLDPFGQPVLRVLVTGAVGSLTLAFGVILAQLEFPHTGSIAGLAINLLATQGLTLGVHLWGSSPGNQFFSYMLATGPFLGTTLAMPLLAYLVLIQAVSARTGRRRLRIALAAFLLWITYLCGVALGYALLLPIAADWVAGPARGPIAPATPVPILLAPIYVGSVANLLLTAGLVVLAPVAVYVMGRLGAVRRGGILHLVVVAAVFAALLLVQFAGPRFPFNLAMAELVFVGFTFEAVLVLTSTPSSRPAV
jgi:Sec-independent protein secretion pathway component TatC